MRKGKRTFASRKRKIAGLCAFVLAGLMGLGAYAFTASNTIPAQAAGGGTAAVSGYTETGVSYTWSLTGEYITEAHFILTSATAKLEPTDVAVALTAAATPVAEEWVDCPGAYTAIGGAEKEWEVVCKFKGGLGAFESAAKQAGYKYTGTGVPNAEGVQLSVSAVSEGKVIVEP
ncbi:MAG: hypothetical protein ABSG93_17160 [Solirubrobacteraceae bacterium]|jgi:hypothetical protein